MSFFFHICCTFHRNMFFQPLNCLLKPIMSFTVLNKDCWSTCVKKSITHILDRGKRSSANNVVNFKNRSCCPADLLWQLFCFFIHSIVVIVKNKAIVRLCTDRCLENVHIIETQTQISFFIVGTVYQWRLCWISFHRRSTQS